MTRAQTGANMNEQADRPDDPASRNARDRRAKLAFVAIALVVAGAVYWWVQRNPRILTGWSEDLDAALKQAAAENRKAALIFHANPPGATTRWLAKNTLAKSDNRKALDRGEFLRIRVKLNTALNSPTATRFKIRKLPTMLLLGPDGKELNRREGKIGEVEFRQEFLTCKVVYDPSDARP